MKLARPPRGAIAEAGAASPASCCLLLQAVRCWELLRYCKIAFWTGKAFKFPKHFYHPGSICTICIGQWAVSVSGSDATRLSVPFGTRLLSPSATNGVFEMPFGGPLSVEVQSFDLGEMQNLFWYPALSRLQRGAGQRLTTLHLSELHFSSLLKGENEHVDFMPWLSCVVAFGVLGDVHARAI